MLEVVVIRRGDTGSWALPGGMIDKGETPTEALKREFKEEAMAPKQNKDKDNKDDAKSSSSRRSEVDDLADRIFSSSSNDCIYTGYIDDIRNTDNAVSKNGIREKERHRADRSSLLSKFSFSVITYFFILSPHFSFTLFYSPFLILSHLSSHYISFHFLVVGVLLPSLSSQRSFSCVST